MSISLHQKVLQFTERPIFLVTTIAVFDKSVFAQLASSVTQSSNILNHNNFTDRYFFVFSFGLFFCASIFWWRREKSREETLERRSSLLKGKAKKGNEPKLSSQKAKSAGDKTETEANADVASWIQNKFENSNQTGGELQETLRKTNHQGSLVLEKITPDFQLPPSPSPLVPLPISKDEALLDAIKQIQPFNASEEERESAISVLISFKSSNSVEALTQVAHYDESARLRIAALCGLGEFDHESVFEPVLLTCADPAREVRASAAKNYARLSVNRAEAYTRIVESKDSERLRLASMVCIDAGLAKHLLTRLSHLDRQQVNDAFAMVRLLAAAGQFNLITDAINNPQDIKAGLIMIKALQVIKPIRMLPALYHLTTLTDVSPEIKKALNEIIEEMSTPKKS